MGAEGRAGPEVLTGNSDTGVLGGRADGYDIEVLPIALEGLVGEDGIHGSPSILEEEWHLSLGVAFGKDGKVDAVLRRTRLDEVLVGQGGLLRTVVDQDISRIYALHLCGDDLCMRTA